MQALDIELFRLINQRWTNPLLDWLMPKLSWNRMFPVLLLAGLAAIFWRGGRRGRLAVVFLAMVMVIGDGVICSALKNAVARPRPFISMPETRTLLGHGGSGSMPSSHAANWFGAATVIFVFYRSTFWAVAVFAALVGYSRIYTGMHYPSDVAAGALVGMGSSLLIMGLLDWAWRTGSRRWLPEWHSWLPSLLWPAAPAEPQACGGKLPPAPGFHSTDQSWLRLGYGFIAVVFLARIAYLASGKIELSEDEAYQWLWSKHLALSYFSKPPMIAYTQFLGTALFGDTALGVRFFSPVLAALGSILIFRFLAREASIRAAWTALLMCLAAPLAAVGSILMTIDPLSVFFWLAAMLSGWRAIKENSTVQWLWTGAWMGLGFLSKYTALFQLLSWATLFLVWPPARTQLRRPGPYLAVLLLLLSTIPVLWWNQQNGWITVTHLANRGGLDQAWRPTLNFFRDFVLAETALLNPIYLLAIVWAAAGFWKMRPLPPLLLYFFAMGAPLFVVYLLYTFRARVQPNWIAPAIIPLFCLASVYWNRHWDQRFLAGAKKVFAAATGAGLALVLLLHDTNVVAKIIGQPLRPKIDPLTRVRGWKEVSAAVSAARQELSMEGKPVFVIGDHYGITGLLSFYIPEAKAAVRTTPIVYYQSSERPENQFFFWPGYGSRTGQNAIYVQEGSEPEPAPERLLKEFESVKELGVRDILYRGRIFHRLHLFECRGLR